MNFLPPDYTPPASAGGNYLKLQQGENHLRILSKPLLGWEIWLDGHPYRHPYEEMPESVGENRPREFWAMIAWNYDQEKIQIFHITQGSIKKSIRDLAEDSGWGSPHQYDLRIVRSGHQLKTNYSVTPQPKTPVADEIKQAFDAMPCYLPALFKGEDPFAPHESVTPPLWLECQDNSITPTQYRQIVDLIGDDMPYLEKVTQGVKKTFGVDLERLPIEHFDKVLMQVKQHNAERLKKEMGGEDDLPF